MKLVDKTLIGLELDHDSDRSIDVPVLDRQEEQSNLIM